MVSRLSTVGRRSHFILLMSSHLLSSCRWSPNHYSNTYNAHYHLLNCIQTLRSTSPVVEKLRRLKTATPHTPAALNVEFVFHCTRIVASSFFRFLCRISVRLVWKWFGSKIGRVAQSVGFALNHYMACKCLCGSLHCKREGGAWGNTGFNAFI